VVESRTRRGCAAHSEVARGKEKGSRENRLRQNRQSLGGKTEDLTWDSIVVPRLAKYQSYSSPVGSILKTLMASAAIPKRMKYGAKPHGDSPRGTIPLRSYRIAERIVSYQSDRSIDRIIRSISNRKHMFVARAISEIPELSHGIQTGVPDHSKHPSLLSEARRHFLCIFISVSGPAFPENLLQSIARLLIRSRSTLDAGDKHFSRLLKVHMTFLIYYLVFLECFYYTLDYRY